MAPPLCHSCHTSRAIILRPKNHHRLCKPCFLSTFEREVHETIVSNALFTPGERVAIGASGGKDSTVLASVLKTLNERHSYGLDLVLLSIDEGIKGYRDDSLRTVERNARDYGLPLMVLGYAELYGWTMDQVVAQVGKKGNCTYCGVFRRQALDRGAARLGVGHVVTGHNADDMAETVLMNLLRGDLPRLSRTTSIMTSSPSATSSSDKVSNVKRSKPLKYAYEKEIVLYAHHKKLEYFSTECIYSPEAFRGSARALVKNLERIRASAILDIVRSGEDMAKLVPGGPESCVGGCGSGDKPAVPITDALGEGEGGCGSATGSAGLVGEMQAMENQLRENEDAANRGLEVSITSIQNAKLSPQRNGSVPSEASTGSRRQPGKGAQKNVNKGKAAKQTLGQCSRCGYLSSQAICKACVLLEGLNKNRPKNQITIATEDDKVGEDDDRRIVNGIRHIDVG